MKIDLKLSTEILNQYNLGHIGQEPRIELSQLPQIDNSTVLNFNDNYIYKADPQKK